MRVLIPVPVIGAMVIIVALGIFITIQGKKPKREADISKQKTLKKIYNFAATFFITQGQTNKIYSNLAALSIFSKEELRVNTTKILLLTSGLSAGLVVVSVILFKEIVPILICVAFAVLINTSLVTKQIEKTNLKVYLALKHAISSIRQEYMRLNSVAEAIAEADIPQTISKPLNQIHTILTSADGELKLLEFYESSPFRALQTLAGISYNIHNYGDGTDEYGQSNFIQALTMLVMDVNSEIQRLVTMETKFGKTFKLEYLTLAPIFIIGVVESYFLKIIPGTALIYNGVVGHVGKVITLICSIICYSIVANINTVASIKEDDRIPILTKILRHNRIRQIVYNITPKNFKSLKMDKKLKQALSRKSLEDIYAEKLLWSIAAFLIAIMTIVSTVGISREFLMNSTQQLSLVSTGEMEDYTRDQILELDYSYINREEEWTDDNITENIRQAMPGLTDLQIMDQVKRMKDKDKAVKASYFNWYYMVACIVVSILAWNGPDILMGVRKYLIAAEVEEDFLQIQTLVAILMNTEMDTLDVLWQMCQHSRIHKDMLLYCYHSYPSDPEKELVRLQSKTPLIEFKRFIGKLILTIRDLSIREAFSDLKIERDHMVRVREINIYSTIDKKRGISGRIVMIPLGLLVAFELLLPLGYLGVNEFMSALGSMGAM